jgi:hypothetical protein
LESAIDWDRVFSLAEHWEVEPVFFAHVARLETKVPKEVVDRAKTAELRARSRATAATLWTVEAVRIVQEAGIRCLVLKGPALGVVAYGDLSFRTFADADLLVRKNDLDRASRYLQRSGFEPLFSDGDEKILIQKGHALEFASNGRKVELHSTLLSRHLALELPPEELFASAISIQVAGQEIYTLDRSSLFVFLCAHGAKHEWERFRWVCDVAQLVARLTSAEMTRVADLAYRHNAKRIVLLALELARSIAYADIDLPTVRRFGEPSTVASFIQRCARHYELLAERPPSPGPDDFESRLSALAYWVRTRERTRDRLTILGRAFLAPVNDSGRTVPVAVVRRIGRLMRLAYGRRF